MKYIIALALFICVASQQRQEFVRSGTGVKGIHPQYDKSVYGTLMKEGCYFMAACVIGGIGNDKGIKEAYNFALNKKYINAKAWVTGTSSDNLARQVASRFGTQYHAGWSLKKGCNHYWTIDGSGREVFNAAGLGYTGCK